MMGLLATLPANMDWLLTRVQFSVTLTFLFALAAAFLLRRAAAALRHRVWALSVLAAVVLPTLISLVPERRVVAIGLRPAPNAAVEGRPKEPAGPAHIAYYDGYSSRREAPGAVPAAFPADGSMPATATTPSFDTPRTVTARAANERLALPPAPFPGSTHQANRKAPALIGLWAVVTLLLIARQGYGIVRRNQLLRHATNIQGSRAGAALMAVCRRHGIAVPPRLVVTSSADSPLCVGSFVPCIVLPADWPTWPAEQLQAVLTHELAHVVRRDVLWQQLARLACAIHWPNPLAWVAAWRMRVERELACDDFVLRDGESATRYVRWLITFAETLGRRSAGPQTVGVAMAAGNRFEQRVRAILDARRPRNGVSMRAGVAMALAALALLGVAGVVSPFSALSVRRAAAAASPAAGPATLPATEPTSARTFLLTGTVVDEAGKPVASPLVTLTLGVESQPVVGDARGRFSFRVEPKQLRYFSLVARTGDGSRQAFFDRENGGDELPTGLVMTLKPARDFVVTVKDKNGAAVAGAWVAGEGYPMLCESVTDETGRATLRVPRDGPLQSIIADKPGSGIDYVMFFRKDEAHSDPYRLAFDYSGPVDLTLHDTIPVSVRVVDDKNLPLSDVRVFPWTFELPKKAGYINVQWPHFAKYTNDHGTASFDVPADIQQRVGFWTRLKGYVAPKRCIFDPKVGKRDLLATLAPLVRVTGHVMDQHGNDAVDTRVDAFGSGYEMDYFRGDTRTDGGGNFAIDANPEMFYIFVASAEGQSSAASYAMVRSAPLAKPIELSLKQTTRVFGTAVHGPNDEPLRGEAIVLEQDDNAYYKLPIAEQFPGGTNGRFAINPTVQSTLKTDAQGGFETRIGPGRYVLFWSRPSDSMRYEASRFTVTDQSEMEVNFHLLHEPKPAGPELLTGRVVLRDAPRVGASEAKLTAYSFGGNDRPFATTNADGGFVTKRGSGEMYIGAASADGKLLGIVHIGAKDRTATVPIGLTASADGRLIDTDGKPLAGRTISYGFNVFEEGGVASGLRFGGSVTTNDSGLFQLNRLVPGYPYALDVAVREDSEGVPNVWRRVGSVQSDKAETVHAGDLTLAPEPHEKTASDYAKEAFAAKGTIGERYDAARRRARVTTTNLLILVGRPDLPNCGRFYEFSNTMDTSAVREQLLGYTKLAVDVRSTADARRLIEGLGIHWPAEGELALAVVDPDGKLLAQAGEKDLCVNGVLDGGRLMAFTKAHVPDLPDARELLAGALAQAKREDKRVILDESAPWCTWCVKLAEYVQANQAAFDRDFVFLTIDRRFKSGDAVLDQFRKEPGSIPWIVILDADGKPLITSDAPGTGNAGYPGDEASLAHWEKMLRTGAKRLSSAEIHALVRKTVEK